MTRIKTMGAPYLLKTGHGGQMKLSTFQVAPSRAFYWQELLDAGVVISGTESAKREGLHHPTVNELLRLC